MNCYNFEANISAYIDGELNQSDWKGFTEHQQNCPNCKSKLVDIRTLIGSIKNIPKVTTSQDFFQNLQRKIDVHENKKSFISRLLQLKPFGLNPLPALGFGVAIVFMVVSSFMLFKTDKLPVVDFEQLSRAHQQQVPAGVQNPGLYQQRPPALMASGSDPAADTTKNKNHNNTNNFDKQMQLVNQLSRP